MKNIVFFDIDNTLIKGQSQQYLIRYLYQKKLLKPIHLFRLYFWFLLYKLVDVDPKKIMEYSFAKFANWKTGDVQKLMNEFHDSVLKGEYFIPGINLVRKHQDNGCVIVVVSNVIKPLADCIARNLNINYVIATELEIKDGKYTGKISGDIIYGTTKRQKATELINYMNLSLDNSYSYADHYTDLSILEIATYPVAVNPDKKLKKVAQKRHWAIIE